MGANKNIDDQHVTLKGNDDPIFSYKFNEDPHVSIKFNEDPIKYKFFDDPLIVPNYKIIGDPITVDPNQIVTQPYIPTAQPFILSTPHHSMQWMQSLGYAATDPNDPKTRITQYESHLQQVDNMKQNLQNQLKQLEEHQQAISQEYNKLRDQQKEVGKEQGQ